ncbi:UDP-N-acetylglucosamine--LPS N-acetylglucosamine transferase [Neptuniibacter sp. 2_MG-2023]|uniref:UDP-N-acetylglucosamine--LPS N-acetylglucosamine transferase n=1 Tax=Neptuniibacter sp. 2_MG-2023 TaxID=3062671 RepID=UPI0026E17F99|nr:UDP-N-acetylglucosamine--LPS N-acetylglucosamine transferase [Neptuniibacter sp. 2_MG-2023]MDO6512892.1 UDP-N-acetylglucosamine--LPS N-acetylglucosamine transferase [Neptuniibacter sp. 2_MG-2023]
MAALDKKKRVVAIASGGGHWKQLMQLRDAFDECEVVYITTIVGLAEKSGIDNALIVPDANRNEKIKVLALVLALFRTILSIRPDVVVTTGAAPGLVAIAFGRIFGAKTLWIDSVANAETLSMAGKLSKTIAHKTLSQWPDVAKENAVDYKGSVI